jgi:Na+-transporting NADH:ubiquinone oxidoreductase subunit NqrC
VISGVLQMNRINKEERLKYIAAREGLSEEQIKALDIKEQHNQKIVKLAKTMHTERFPEEYDFMYDSSSEAKERRKGINPMSQEYIKKVNQKRNELGVSALTESGMSVSNDTMLLCIEEAETILGK